MLNNQRLKEGLNSISEYLNDQEWYLQLKGKWEELDPQSRNYLKLAGIAGGVLLIVSVIFSAIWSVHSLKSELSEKHALLSMIDTANEEMRRLKDITPNMTGGGDSNEDSGPWNPYFESLVTSSGIDKTSLGVAGEKAGHSGDQSKETLFDLTLKHVNIKQLIRFAFSLENGKRPVKVRNLNIDAKPDSSGYLDASLAVSAFTFIEQN